MGGRSWGEAATTGAVGRMSLEGSGHNRGQDVVQMLDSRDLVVECSMDSEWFVELSLDCSCVVD